MSKDIKWLNRSFGQYHRKVKFNDLIAEIQDDLQINSQTTNTQNDDQGGTIDEDENIEIDTNPIKYNLRSRKGEVTDLSKKIVIQKAKANEQRLRRQQEDIAKDNELLLKKLVEISSGRGTMSHNQ